MNLIRQIQLNGKDGIFFFFLVYSLVSTNCELRTHYLTSIKNQFTSFIKLLGVGLVVLKVTFITNNLLCFSFYHHFYPTISHKDMSDTYVVRVLGASICSFPPLI